MLKSIIQFIIGTRIRNKILAVLFVICLLPIFAFTYAFYSLNDGSFAGDLAMFFGLNDTFFNILLAASAGAFALGFLLITIILRPLHKFKEGAKEIDNKNLDTRITVNTNDEFHLLAHLFNRMAQSMKRLEELKNEFIFIAAHELRNPITAIRGHIYLAGKNENDGLSPEKKGYLEQMDKSMQHLAQIITDFLEIVKSDTGRTVIEVTAIDIEEPIKMVIAELLPLAQEKSLTLTYESVGAMPLAIGNTERIKEVIMNLVNNAIKYTPNGGKITVAHEVEKNQLITNVQDNGFGISPADQKRLFEKFFRVKNEKTAAIKGTGLGLFIVKEIVEKMNGHIWVQSEPDKGSTFSFSLALARQ